MLTLTELDKLLSLNSALTLKAIAAQDLKAMLRLSLHRATLKDCYIERLQAIVELKPLTITKAA